MAGNRVIVQWLSLASAVPADATAVVLNLTGTAPTASTYVTVWPEGTPRPTASTLNLAAGQTTPNLVTVALDTGKKVALYNNSGVTHLIADLAAYYATGSGAGFGAAPPSRVLDTRAGVGRAGALGPGQSFMLSVQSAVPYRATAVVLNLTGTAPTASTFVTAWPDGRPRPTASNLNLVAGQTAPNLVTVALGDNATVSLFNNAGSVHLLADVAGYYLPDAGAVFFSQTPQRVLDTRTGTAPLGPGASLALGLSGAVPGAATSVVLNLTGTAPTQSTYLSAWPDLNPRPEVSNLNLAAGATRSNLAVVSLGMGEKLRFFNANGATDVLADLAGYFAMPPPSCTTACVYAWGLSAAVGDGRPCDITGLPACGSDVPVRTGDLTGVR
jgi:hypothetical protein